MEHIKKMITLNSQIRNKVNTINAFQGAVMQDSFKVNVKVNKFDKGLSLNVYSDIEKTQLVFQTIDKVCDELFYISFMATDLVADTKYYWSINYKGGHTFINGEIKTLPSGNASFKIIAGSCAVGSQIEGINFRYSNHEIFKHLATRSEDIALLWHIGDIHYQDIQSDEVKPYCDAFDGVLRQSNQQNLYLKTSLMYMWDDHDFTGNDSNGAKNLIRTKAAIEAYRKRIPHYETPFTGVNDPICHSVMIGRVLLINLDCRTQKDKHAGTILGTKQKTWLKDLMLNTDAKAFIINVSVPWISPSGGDMWGSVALERQELMNFWSDNSLTDKIVILAGDAHMVAIDDGSNNGGIPVYQFSAFDSPTTFKGGPYSEGSSLNLNQYGMFDVQDKGTSIDIIGSSYRFIDGLSEALPQTYTKTIII